MHASLTGWLQSVYLPWSEAFRRLIEFDISLLIQEHYSIGEKVWNMSVKCYFEAFLFFWANTQVSCLQEILISNHRFSSYFISCCIFMLFYLSFQMLEQFKSEVESNIFKKVLLDTIVHVIVNEQFSLCLFIQLDLCTEFTMLIGSGICGWF